MAQGERKPPGLPSLYKARADRAQGRYSRGSPALWLGIVASLAAIVVGYRYVESRQLATSKDELLAKERAVQSTVGAAWFPLRDGLEQIVIDAATKPLPDYVDPTIARWDFRTAPGIYLRVRSAEARDVASLRKATTLSARDGFVGCLLREPNASAARGDADAGAFPEQPWNWKKAYDLTRILTDAWSDEVRASDDPLRLKVFEEQYDKAMKDEIPAAVELVKRAQFFLFVLDDDAPDVKPSDPAAGVTEADLQKAPHAAHVHLLDLRSHTEVLRLRTEAEAGFVFAGDRPVTDPETLDAMKRQVNNCALAKAVDKAIKDSAAH